MTDDVKMMMLCSLSQLNMQSLFVHRCDESGLTMSRRDSGTTLHNSENDFQMRFINEAFFFFSFCSSPHSLAVHLLLLSCSITLCANTMRSRLDLCLRMQISTNWKFIVCCSDLLTVYLYYVDGYSHGNASLSEKKVDTKTMNTFMIAEIKQKCVQSSVAAALKKCGSKRDVTITFRIIKCVCVI